MLWTIYTTELQIRAGYAAYTAMLDRRDMVRACYFRGCRALEGFEDGSRGRQCNYDSFILTVFVQVFVLRIQEQSGRMVAGYGIRLFTLDTQKGSKISRDQSCRVVHVDATQFTFSREHQRGTYRCRQLLTVSSAGSACQVVRAPPDSAAFSCVKCKTQTSVSNSIAATKKSSSVSFQDHDHLSHPHCELSNTTRLRYLSSRQGLHSFLPLPSPKDH